MGRYSSWWSRLLIIGIIVAIVTPIGIYAVPQMEPYLNLLPFYEDPSNAVVKGMNFVASDADTNGHWTWALTRMDLQFNNPLDSPLKIPAADLSVRYLGGRLGDGYIDKVYYIPANGSGMVSMYMKLVNVGEQAELFSTFLKAMFWGQDLTLNADINAYILIDGLANEPLMGIKFPLSIEVPLPIGLHGWAPLIYDITPGLVGVGAPVAITVNAADPGSGIYYSDPTNGITGHSYIYYKVNPSGDWNQTTADGRVALVGPAWDNTFGGLQVGGPFPISSSDPDNPVLLTGSIPGFGSGSNVQYFIYLEDYAGNWEHKNQANHFESEKLSYVVGGAAPSPVHYNVKWDKPFIVDYLDYIDSHGINLLNFLYNFGVDLLQFTPLLGVMSQTLYKYNVDMDYFLALLMTDFTKGVIFMADSGLPPGILLDILGEQFGFRFDDMVTFMLPRIWYPFEGEDNITQLATNTLALKASSDPEDNAKFDALKAQFNSLGITRTDFLYYVDPYGSAGLLGYERAEFRSVYTLEISVTILIWTVTIRFQGNIIKDFVYDDYGVGPPSGETQYVYENWLRLVQMGSEEKPYYWAAANLLLKSPYAENQPARSQELFATLLNSKLDPTPEAFPANDLYPYTHQFVSLVMLLCLGVVSYLVLKREYLIHRKVERGLAAKKKLTQKKAFDKDAKVKAQSKYL